MALLAARNLPHCWRRHVIISQSSAVLEMARPASAAQRTVRQCRSAPVLPTGGLVLSQFDSMTCSV